MTFSPLEKSLGWSSTNSVSITALWQQPKTPPALGVPHQVMLWLWYLSNWTCNISEPYQRWPTARRYNIPTNWAQFVWKCAGAVWQIQNWAPRAAVAEETRSSRRVGGMGGSLEMLLNNSAAGTPDSHLPHFLLHYSWQWVRAGERERAGHPDMFAWASGRTVTLTNKYLRAQPGVPLQQQIISCLLEKAGSAPYFRLMQDSVFLNTKLLVWITRGAGNSFGPYD